MEVKKAFVEPVCEVETFAAADILTTSNDEQQPGWGGGESGL